MEHRQFSGDLEKIGLSEKEALIYEVLLETGGAYPSAISHSTKLNRSTVYKILTSLSIKGIVNEVEKGKKLFYQIEKPEQLLKYTKQRAELAKDSFRLAEDLLPLLEDAYARTPNKPKVRFFQDVNGLISILDDHLSTGIKYEMLGFANTTGIEEIIPADYFKKFVKEKERQGITTRGIVPDSQWDKSFNDRIYKNAKKKGVMPVLRHIPAESFPFNGEIIIYGNSKVSFFNFESRDRMLGVIIEDVWIHRAMRMIFELAWKGAKQPI
jgi:sugar-specific transcriptional regulator TrmB